MSKLAKRLSEMIGPRIQGLTKAQAAKEIGISRPTLDALLAGGQPSIATIRKLVKAGLMTKSEAIR